MALVDINALLKPVSPENPVGENLEYSPEYTGLERAAQAKAGGGMVTPKDGEVEPEEPDWGAVQKKAVELFAKTKDLRIAMILARALLATDGIKGLANGVTLIRGLLDQYWDMVYPQLDPEDDNDQGFRINSLVELVHPDTLAKVRTARFLEPEGRGLAPICLREIAYALELAHAPEGQSFAKTTLDAVIGSIGPEKVAATDQMATELRDNLVAIEAIFDSHKSGQSPDLSPLVQIIAWGKKGLAGYLESADTEASTEDGATGNNEAGSGAVVVGRPFPVSVPGQIASRNDVLATIDKIVTYYQRNEPTSPVPLLLARCKRLVMMSFLDIVRDLAPDALGHVELIVGKSDETNSSEEPASSQ